MSDSSLWPAPPPQPLPPPPEEEEDEDEEAAVDNRALNSAATTRASILTSVRETRRHSFNDTAAVGALDVGSAPEEVVRAPLSPRRALRPSMSRHVNRTLPKPPMKDHQQATEEVIQPPLPMRKVMRPSMSRHKDRTLPMPPFHVENVADSGVCEDQELSKVPPKPKSRRRFVPSLSRHIGRKVPLPPTDEGTGPATLPRRTPARNGGLFHSLSRRKPLPKSFVSDRPETAAFPPASLSSKSNDTTKDKLPFYDSRAKYHGAVVANDVASDVGKSMSNTHAPAVETVNLRPVQQDNIAKSYEPVTESVVLRHVPRNNASRPSAASLSSKRGSMSSQGSNSGTRKVSKTPPAFWRGRRVMLPPTQELDSHDNYCPFESEVFSSSARQSQSNSCRPSHAPADIGLPVAADVSKFDAETPISATGTILPPVPRGQPPSSMRRSRPPQIPDKPKGNDLPKRNSANSSQHHADEELESKPLADSSGGGMNRRILDGVSVTAEVKDAETKSTADSKGTKGSGTQRGSDSMRRITSAASSAIVPVDYEDPAFSDISSPSMGAEISPDIGVGFPSLGADKVRFGIFTCMFM